MEEVVAGGAGPVRARLRRAPSLVHVRMVTPLSLVRMIGRHVVSRLSAPVPPGGPLCSVCPVGACTVMRKRVPAGGAPKRGRAGRGGAGGAVIRPRAEGKSGRVEGRARAGGGPRAGPRRRIRLER
ncbi:hypothetical protein GCM10018789_22420 [Streptomyces werraensis]|nr:hypothetical protein GCM10018789_22420 [Streptomyces werraensis]